MNDRSHLYWMAANENIIAALKLAVNLFLCGETLKKLLAADFSAGEMLKQINSSAQIPPLLASRWV